MGCLFCDYVAKDYDSLAASTLLLAPEAKRYTVKFPMERPTWQGTDALVQKPTRN